MRSGRRRPVRQQPAHDGGSRVGPTQSHAPSLYRALASKEIFAETAPGTSALTPMAEFLRADHPLTLKDAYPLVLGVHGAAFQSTSSVRRRIASRSILARRGEVEYMDAAYGISLLSHAMDAPRRVLLPRYDPAAADVVADPYPVYARLREIARVCRGGPGQWVVTRYDDVARLLGSEALGTESGEAARAFALGTGPAAEFYGRILLYRDGAVHARLRSMLKEAVATPVAALPVTVLPGLVDTLLRPALDGAPFDCVRDFAIPLSFRVLCGLVGFPPGDAPQLQPHALDLSRAFGTRVASEDRAAADRAVVWLRQYVGELLEECRRTDRDDVLSRLARAHESGDVTVADVVDNVAFLLFAGFETTAHQIGNAVAALLAHPDEVARLRGQPRLLPRCVEETLRYDPPIQGVVRVVRESIVVGDHAVKPGRVLVLLLGSANRDGQRFADPDGFHADRAPNPHVSFGGGGHYCLGALLARLELTAALDGFLRRTAAIDLAAPPMRERGTRFRCYASIPVAVRPA